jgi:hypothetical protein
LGVVTVPA